MKNSMTKKMIKGFYATADFWREQAFGKLLCGKSEWLRYKELEWMQASCAFCEYTSNINNSGCNKCPINDCFDNGFRWWDRIRNPKTIRRLGAIRLWFKIKKWMKANLPEYFNK